MRLLKILVAFVAMGAVLLSGLPNAGAVFRLFGDSSWAFGTALDEDGNRTICSDGFELLVASTPNNGPYEEGEPTGAMAGDTRLAPLIAVVDDKLVEDHVPDTSFLIEAETPGGFIYIDSRTGQPAADLYGFVQAEVELSETFYFIDGINRALDGFGTAQFTPSTPLPVGEDVVLITDDFKFFRSYREVTVVDCTPAPEVDVAVSDVIKPDKAKKKIKVDIINDGTFTTVDNVTINGATPLSSKAADVDGDGDLDTRYTIATGASGVSCGDTTMTVTGLVDGVAFETDVPITTNC